MSPVSQKLQLTSQSTVRRFYATIHPTGCIMFSGCPSVRACVRVSGTPGGDILDRLAVDF